MTLTSSPFQAQPEFIIYSFKKDETSKGSSVWQASSTHENEVDAIRKANALFSSARYTRVEVRKKSIDEETGRINDEAVKILDSMPGKVLPARMLLATAFLCVLIAGFITIFG